jgi:hypothetical protein
MIKYRLICGQGHEFEGWFQSSATFDTQAETQQIRCLSCGSTGVTKAMMAPRIGAKSSSNVTPADVAHWMKTVRDKVVANSEYVGARFAEVARQIHYENADARGIYGEATAQEAADLCGEGIAVLPLPRLPEELN